MATSEVGKLRIELEASTARFEQGLERVNKRMGSLSKSAGGLSSAFSTAGKGLLAFVSIRGLSRVASDMLATADAIQKASERAGLSPERFQGLQYAAQSSSVQMEALSTSLQKFNQRVGEAQAGKEFGKVLESIGIEIRDAGGGFKSTEQVLFEYADAIKNASTSSRQLFLLNKAFEEQGARLLPVFRDGAAGIREYTEAAKRLGIVVSDADLKKLEDVATRIDQLTFSIKRFALTQATAAFDILERLGIDTGGTPEERLRRVREAIEREQETIDTIIRRGQERRGEIAEPEGFFEGFVAELKSAAEGLKLAADAANPLRENIAALRVEERALTIEVEARAAAQVEGSRAAAEQAAIEAAAARRAKDDALAFDELMFQISKQAKDEATAWQEELDELERVLDRIGQSVENEDRERAKLIDRSISGTELAAAAADRAFSSLGSSAVDAFFEADFAADRFFKGLARDLASLTVQAAIFGTVKKILGASFFAADGAVFSGGQVVPFASGGILSGPTAFPLSGGRTGVAGEAGPEGVFPITRDSRGRLGVVAVGGGSSKPIQVNVSTTINNSGPPDQNGASTGRAVEQAVNRAMARFFRAQAMEERRPGGALNPVL